MKATAMLKFKWQFSAGLLAGALLVGCAPDSPKATTPTENKSEKIKNAVLSVALTQTLHQQVDILFVIDDSASMQAHQADLSSNIRLFVAEMQKSNLLDYHIGVVTTSMDGASPYDPTSRWPSGCDYAVGGAWGGSTGRPCGDGKLVHFKTHVPFVDRQTPNGLSVLEENILVGTEGSSEEMSFDPISAALSSPMMSAENTGFLRKDASLAIIIMTDAEDQSQTMSPETLNDFLVNLKNGKADKVLTYAAIVPSSVTSPSCTRDEYGVTPLRIEQFLKLSGGTEFNICDADYGTKLAAIAKDVTQKVGKLMYLSRAPVVNTISVKFGLPGSPTAQVIPNDASTGWTYDPTRNALIFGDKLIFDPKQPAGSAPLVNFTTGI